MNRKRFESKLVKLFKSITNLDFLPTHRLSYREKAGNSVRRDLKRHEIVHHVNGDHNDNRPCNLQIVNVLEHRRLHCIMKYKDVFHCKTCDSILTLSELKFKNCQNCRDKHKIYPSEFRHLAY